MDTGTHLVMGLGIFGLAHLDPTIAADAATAKAVLIGTVVGSQIPDIDGLYRLKGNAAYIRNHRGWTHSLPMLIVWPIVLSALILIVFPHADWMHVWAWTFLAVFIHIFIDIFNTYGTQALKPLSNRWISLDLINIFDPFIFAIHLVGFVLWWIFPEYAGTLFLTIYLLIVLYIIWRARIHARLLKWVKEQVKQEGRYALVPTFRFQVWNVLLEQEDQVLMGEIRNGQLNWTGRLSTEFFHHPATQLSKQAEAIDAFLSFTSHGYPQIIERSFGYEVRWLDVRYHHKKHFPFVAVALISHEGEILHSFVGWMSEEHLEKKVQYLTS